MPIKKNNLFGQKRSFRPFISSNLLRIIAIILLMTGQISAMLLIYNKVFPDKVMNDDKLRAGKKLITIAMPLYLTSIITNIVRYPERIKKFVLSYFAAAVLFAVAEIIFFVPFVKELLKYVLAIEGEMSAETDELVRFILRYALSYFANLNVYLDLFIASLMAFFLLYNPKTCNRKRIVLFRLCVIFPVLYLIASFVLSGLFRRGCFVINVEEGAFLLHRNYLCFIFFIGVIVYQKFRNKLYYRFNDGVPFDEYKRSARGLFCYNAILILFLSALCAADYLLGLISGAADFGVGKSYVLLWGLPVLLMFNAERRVHNKTANAVSCVLYVFFGTVLIGGYAAILDKIAELVQDCVPLAKDIMELISRLFGS